MWIPLLQYALKTGISLSTLRRHIKANKIQFQLVNGKYFLLDQNSENPSEQPENLRKLESDLQQAKEEIVELKTLIAFYEEKIPQPMDR